MPPVDGLNPPEMPFNTDMIEPPPELPLHSFLMDPPRSRKKIVNKLKGLLGPSKEPVLKNEFEDIPLRPPAFPLVEDSTKTFLTGNAAEPIELSPEHLLQQHLQEHHQQQQQYEQQQQQQQQQQQRQQYEQQQQQRQQIKSGIAIPQSTILEDPSAFSNFSSSLHIKHIGLRSCVKRLNSIAQRKLETSKCTQKFLRDLISWGQNSSFDNLDSLELVNEIQLIFQQDLVNEQTIAQRLKQLASELDFVCIREQELAQEKKNLAFLLKKHRYSLEKKGETHDETIVLKEKVIAQERAFESYKLHYQLAISITARHAFKELGIDLYERASDLKEISGEFLRITMQTLESVNGDEFVKDLEKIRLVRAERNWSKLSREQKTNPQSWFDLVSGKKDGDDTLMQKVCQGLPKEYSPFEPRFTNSKQDLKLDFPTSELDETTSVIQSGRFNPITSNEYFSPRTGQQQENEQEYENLNLNEYEHENEDGNENENYTSNDNNKDGIKEKETIVRSVDPNVFNNDISGEIPTQRHSEGKKPPPQDDNPNGFILNFSNISQQFDDAEKDLQENRWLD